jgi:hypothetical protein
LAVSNLNNQCGELECTNPNCNPVELPDDILLLNKLIDFSYKLLDCITCVKNENTRNEMQNLQWQLNDRCISEITKTLRITYGFEQLLVNKITVPCDNDPLSIVNMLKEIVNDYLNDHSGHVMAKDRVVQQILTDLLQSLFRVIYLLRVNGIDDQNAKGLQPINIDINTQ